MEIKRMIKENDMDMCCIQETKLEQMDTRLGFELWPGGEFDWVWRDAEGRSGGLISIWNRKVFEKTSTWNTKGLLVVNGRWLEDNVEMVIINVYAPCLFSEKAQLWDLINLVLEQNPEAKICAAGDYNSIRDVEERNGRGGGIDQRDIRLFDEFISASGLVDLKLWGRKYTWYKPDGSCKSKLDRIMVNEDWLVWRPDLKLKSLGRSISDHCPLILRNSVTDWGPKLFKFFNGWAKHPDFKEFCKVK
ncbi:hypothetical protein ACS0TY_031769 [Phlomoides rotata]